MRLELTFNVWKTFSLPINLYLLLLLILSPWVEHGLLILEVLCFTIKLREPLLYHHLYSFISSRRRYLYPFLYISLSSLFIYPTSIKLIISYYSLRLSFIFLLSSYYLNNNNNNWIIIIIIILIINRLWIE